MRNLELRELLKQYPDDWEVWAAIGLDDGPVDSVDSDPDEKAIVITTK